MPNAVPTGAPPSRGLLAPSPVVAALVEAARAAERVGQRAVAREHFERALRALPDAASPPTAAALLRSIAASYLADANHSAAEDCLDAAVACAQACGDEAGVGNAVNLRAALRWQQGELDEAAQLYAEARERAVRAGDSRLAAVTAQNLGVIANVRGDFVRARLFYEASLADYRAMALPRDVCVALNNLGMVHTDLEQWDEAELAYREALELVRDLGDVTLRVQIEVNEVEMWVARGDIPRARVAADAAMALAAQIGEAQAPGDAYKLLGIIARESGELSRAEQLLDRAAEIATARQDLLLLAETAREQAELHRRLGRNRETLQALNRAHTLFTQLRARRDLADVDRQNSRLESEFLDVVRRWSESIEAKDRYTQGHCERVADLACDLAARAGFDDRTLFWFRIGALLHDVGKLIIPAEVLNKPSKLSDDEWTLMKRHPEAGVELLEGIEFPWDVRPLIESHHERWDGRGYPHGLAGDGIPLTARILCLADVFDALTSQRSYKQSMSATDALEIMRRDVGRAFDPSLFDAFEQVVAERDPTFATQSDAAPPAVDLTSARVRHDALTELPLRRASMAAATRLLAVRRRDGRAASLVYVKLDDVADVDRTLGRARADDMLATIADALRRASRPGDVLARFGADDFVLLLADASSAEACEIASGVRSAWGAGAAPNADAPPVSIGVASAPDHGDSLDALVAAARRALVCSGTPGRHGIAVAAGIADPPRPAVERFVGRVPELRRLRQLLDRSLRGDSRIVTVSGAPGVGKSALISRLALDARRHGAVYAAATCRAAAFPTPFGPWIDIIAALHAARITPDRRWHALPRLVPFLAGGGQPAGPADRARGSDAVLYDEVCDLLGAAAARRPLVVVLEDIEHADHASWDVLRCVADRLGGGRLLLCLTTNDPRPETLRRKLAGYRHHSELRLSDLGTDELREWAAEVFPDEGTRDACAAHLASAAASTPLRGVHAVHALVDAGGLVFAAGMWRAGVRTNGAAAPAPASLRALLAGRIACLAPKTRAILAELALLGETFEVDVAIEAGVGDEAEVLDAIDAAVAAALLREVGAEPGAAFAFTHSAVAAAARETLDRRRRRRVHERIARALERVRPVALFEIASQYDGAAVGDRAYEYALLAAARAVSIHAYSDAASAYDRARTHATSTEQRARLEQLARLLPSPAAVARVS